MLNKLKQIIINMLGKRQENESNMMLLYLSNNEALPEPMTSEQEFACVVRMQNGDESAKNELIERNLRLVIYVAQKFENTGVDDDDLISIGSIGLIKAVSTFNTDKKIKLATYASRCIENEILMHLRKVAKQKKETSLDTPLSCDNEGNELLLCDVIGIDADEVYKDIEISAEKEMLYKILDKLNAREQQIINLRYGLKTGEELTQKQVADSLNISQSYISRIEKKILSKMKKEMLKMS